MAIYADERVQRFTAGHDLDSDRFLAGDNTLYLYAPVHEQRRLRPLFETVAMQLVQTAQEQAARAPDGMLDPRLLCALDEAGNVAALELLPEWATTGRGQGIQLVSVWHDQAQLVHRYGDRAATILNGHRGGSGWSATPLASTRGTPERPTVALSAPLDARPVSSSG